MLLVRMKCSADLGQSPDWYWHSFDSGAQPVSVKIKDNQVAEVAGCINGRQESAIIGNDCVRARIRYPFALVILRARNKHFPLHDSIRHRIHVPVSLRQ